MLLIPDRLSYDELVSFHSAARDSEIHHVCNNNVFLFHEGGSPGKNNEELI